MSFSPLNAQPDFAFRTAPVGLPVAEPATPGVPGGPVISPAKTGAALRPEMQTTTASNELLYIAYLQTVGKPRCSNLMSRSSRVKCRARYRAAKPRTARTHIRADTRRPGRHCHVADPTRAPKSHRLVLAICAGERKTPAGAGLS